MLKISDVQNVLILARQGLKNVSENIDAEQGAQAFSSLAALEKWVQTLIKQHEQQKKNTPVDENGQSVQVVEVKNEEVAPAE